MELGEKYVSDLLNLLHSKYYMDEQERENHYCYVAHNANYANELLYRKGASNKHYERLLDNIYFQTEGRDKKSGLGLPGHTRMVKEDNNTVIPFFCARWDGYSILKEEETVEPVVLQDIYTFYDGYTPKMLSGHLALIYNSFCIYVFGMGKKSELTSCPYTQKSIELLKNKILEACYD